MLKQTSKEMRTQGIRNRILVSHNRTQDTGQRTQGKVMGGGAGFSAAAHITGDEDAGHKKRDSGFKYQDSGHWTQNIWPDNI